MERDRHRGWIALGALYGLFAVLGGAGAAHLVNDPAAQRAVNSAVTMNVLHAGALLTCGLLGGQLTHWAAAAFAVGTLLFCGAVYAGPFGLRLGSLAPWGGGVLMLGWALLIVAALRR